MSWTERARNWVKKQFNADDERVEPVDKLAIESLRTQYADRLRAYWQSSYEAYLNEGNEPEFPFSVHDRGDENLPEAVKESIAYYIAQVEAADIGRVELYEMKTPKVFIINTKTDGDDGWVELFTSEGRAVGSGRTFIELIAWGEKETIRKMTADSSFPQDMDDRFERTLWKGDAV